MNHQCRAWKGKEGTESGWWRLYSKPNTTLIYYYYLCCLYPAMFLSEHNRHDEALTLWQKASQIDAADFDVIFNLALSVPRINFSNCAYVFLCGE